MIFLPLVDAITAFFIAAGVIFVIFSLYLWFLWSKNDQNIQVKTILEIKNTTNTSTHLEQIIRLISFVQNNLYKSSQIIICEKELNDKTKQLVNDLIKDGINIKLTT